MKISRRNFIQAGSASLTIPFLEGFSNVAHAQVASGSLKRVLFFGLTNAQYEDHIFPTATNWTTGAEGVRYIPLNSMTGDMSKIFTNAKWGSLKSKMNIMRGFDILTQASHIMPGHETLMPLAACGEYTPNPPQRSSIDNVIANSPQFYATTPFRKAVNIMTCRGAFQYNYSWNNGNQRTSLDGPSKVFSDLFSGTLPGSGTTPPDTNLSRRLAMQEAFNKMTALVQSPKLSAADKQKLDQHADMINDLMPTLAPPTGGSGPGAGCSKPVVPAGINESFNSNSGNQVRIRSCLDQIYMAFNCQLTNVVNFHPVVASDTGNWEMGDGGNDVYHQMAGHHYDPVKYMMYNGWVYDQLLYLLNKMESTVESNGLTMLDNSLVVVISNDGCSIHSYEDMPVITIGSLGGKIKTGNYINYQRLEAASKRGGLEYSPSPQNGKYYHEYTYRLGRPLGSLYCTIMNALGISHSGFGNYDDQKAAYTEFTTAAAKQKSLPIIT